ncbi:UbiD family decarboxylase [Yersinia enterocolitica]
MFLKSVREQISLLQEQGDLRVINRPVDSYLEAAAIIRRCAEIEAPVPLMTNIKDYPGCSIVGGLAALSSNAEYPLSRVAMSLGLPLTATAQDIVQYLVDGLKKKTYLPKEIDRNSAACKQNILHGEKATLARFPIPQVHQYDGNRYVNTWGVFIVESPDGKWCNWSIQRVQYHNDRQMIALVFPSQHIADIWEEWVKIGKPMPYALVQGCEPIVPYVAGLPLLDRDVNEADYIGALYGKGIEVVKCETHHLRVPASSEVVIEGYFAITREGVEGPFGEFAGYTPNENSLQPILSIEAISWQDNPIWPVVAEGKPVDEYHTCSGIGDAAAIQNVLLEANMPVSFVWGPLYSACHLMIVSIKHNWRQLHPDLSSEQLTKKIGDIIHQTRNSIKLPKIVVLDDDIDPTDTHSLLWALSTRVHPEKRRYFYESAILPLLSCYSQAERHSRKGKRVVIDALLPENHGSISSFDYAYPEEIKQRVLKNWVSDFGDNE